MKNILLLLMRKKYLNLISCLKNKRIELKK